MFKITNRDVNDAKSEDRFVIVDLEALIKAEELAVHFASEELLQNICVNINRNGRLFEESDFKVDWKEVNRAIFIEGKTRDINTVIESKIRSDSLDIIESDGSWDHLRALTDSVEKDQIDQI